MPGSLARSARRVAPLLLLSLLLQGLAGAVDLKVDGATAVTKGPGDSLEVTISAAPGLPITLLADVDPGPTTLYNQSLPLGFSPAVIAVGLPNVPASGTIAFTVTLPDDLLGITLHLLAVAHDPGVPFGLDFSNGASFSVVEEQVELAGNSLALYPHFEHVRAFNQGAPVELGIDPSRYPSIVGKTGIVHVVAAKDAAGWQADPTLVDVTATGPKPFQFVAGDITANTLTLDPGTLNGAYAGVLGVGYDVVIDFDQDGQLSAGDLIDGAGDTVGFFVVNDVTQPGPYAVTETLYTGGPWLGQNTFYPTNVAAMGELPLVVISHGNGHNYQWYDHLGFHLASYGYVVMSHENQTGPGVETASTTTLTNTDWFLGNLAAIDNGILVGHVDVHNITWFGHSRGGEGVVRAYDRLIDGQFVPQNYTAADIVLVSSIAPTDFLGPGNSEPHSVPYSLWVGGADADVTGCASNDIAQSFHLHDRAEGTRMSISLHGVGHGDFHNSFGSVATGPCLVGKTDTHTVQRGYALALVEHFAKGSAAARDFLWRQYERFHPPSAPLANPCVVVDLMFREGPEHDPLVIDDFQTNLGGDLSSSGGAVLWTIDGLREGRLDDMNGNFTHDPADLFNGFTQAGPGDDSRGVLLTFTKDSVLVYQMPPGVTDVRDRAYLSFRAAQQPRHPLTTAELADLDFTVALRDGAGKSSAMRISAFGGGIEEPYQRGSCGGGFGWGAEFETIRLPVQAFRNGGSGLDLGDVIAIEFRFGPSHGAAQGRIALDDLQFTNE